MDRYLKTVEFEEFLFINFEQVLCDIRDSFLEEISSFDIPYPVKIRGRVLNRLLKHCVVYSVFNIYRASVVGKKTVLVIPEHIRFSSCNMLDDDKFTQLCLKNVDGFKKMIPFVIKKTPSKFESLYSFLGRNESADYIEDLRSDVRILNRNVVSFEIFKNYVKKNGLSFVLQELIDKIEFRRLFIC